MVTTDPAGLLRPGGSRFSELLRWYARAAWSAIRDGRPALAVYLLTQTVITVILLPVLAWLFREAIGVAGLRGLDQSTLGRLLESPFSIILIALMLVLAFLTATLQLILVAAAIRRSRVGAPVRPGPLMSDLVDVLRRLIGPGSLPLVWYVFVVLPLAQAGFFSVVTHGIAIPKFITGELLKSTAGVVTYAVFLIVACILNTRYALTLPLLVSTNATGARAMRVSARLIRKASLAFYLVIAAIVIAGLAAGAALVRVGIVPTWVTERTLGDGPAPLVAAVSMAVAVLVGASLAGGVVLAIGGALFAALDRGADQLDPKHRVQWLPVPTAELPAALARRTRIVVAGALLLALSGLSVLAYPEMTRTAETPATLILAHRGFAENGPGRPGGVENTISGLEAAAAVGAIWWRSMSWRPGTAGSWSCMTRTCPDLPAGSRTSVNSAWTNSPRSPSPISSGIPTGSLHSPTMFGGPANSTCRC